MAASPRRFATLLLALSASTTTLVDAQSEVRGTVRDSLRGGGIARALVSVQGTAIRALTDANGRYELRGVPTGEHTLVVQSPYLDSMALGALVKPLAVQRNAHELHFSTPTLAQYQRAVCGAPLPDDQAVLIGAVSTVGGDPAASSYVAALWNETVLSTNGASGLLRGAVDTADANGFYVLCGVPVDAEFQVRAGEDTLGTSVLTVSASPVRLRRRDMRVGLAATTVRVRGRLAAGGAGLEGSVTVEGDSSEAIRTTNTGEFELVAAERSGQLWIRVIGYTPKLLDIEPAGEELDLGDIELEKVPVELGTRLIEGRLVSEREAEFEERRKTGAGVFLDSTALARAGTRSVTAVAAISRIARVQRMGRSERLMLRKGADMCSPRVFVDASFVGKTAGGRGVTVIDPEELANFLREAKRVEMYTAPYAPPAFPDFDGCGVVLIWLR